MDASGNLFIADTDNEVIRMVTPSGLVSTVASAPGAIGNSDGTGSGAHFWYPESVAVDSSGTLYVTDGDNMTVRKIASGGVVTTLAGTHGVSGSQDGTAFAWTNPTSADSAILVTLEPGANTAEVSGLSGDSGLALVEIYDVL